VSEVPSKARVVIVGGGVVGCSVAYHLAKRGCTDVVLLERKQLTSGTTWHAAGLVGQLRATHNLTRLAQYTTNLFKGLEAETGQATGFQQRGSVAVAPNEERFEELKRGASMARVFGLPVHVITPADVQDLVPLARVDDLVGAVHLPGDGVVNPIDVTQALAKEALEYSVARQVLAPPPRSVGHFASSRPGQDIQADLIDFSKNTRLKGQPYRYALVTADVFTRKLGVEPLKSKSAGEVAAAMQRELKEMGVERPALIRTDQGKEFADLDTERNVHQTRDARDTNGHFRAF